MGQVAIRGGQMQQVRTVGGQQGVAAEVGAKAARGQDHGAELLLVAGFGRPMAPKTRSEILVDPLGSHHATTELSFKMMDLPGSASQIGGHTPLSLNSSEIESAPQQNYPGRAASQPDFRLVILLSTLWASGCFIPTRLRSHPRPSQPCQLCGTRTPPPNVHSGPT